MSEEALTEAFQEKSETIEESKGTLLTLENIIDRLTKERNNTNGRKKIRVLQLKKGGTFDKIAFYDYLEYFDHVVFLDSIERFSDYANAIDILLSTRGSNQT